jgi:tetratricopeptide (TPR) repeat protein
MPAITHTIITKGYSESLENTLSSLYEVLYEKGDEVLILNTAKSTFPLNKVQDFEGARVVENPLVVDFRPYIEKWLPERLEEFLEAHPDGYCLLDFAAAREITRREARNTVIFWIDSDDTISEEAPGSLRKIVNDTMDPSKPEVDSIFMDYRYAFDPDGTCTTTLRRERFFFRDRYHWVGKCHETAIPSEGIDPPPRRAGYFQNLKASIDHKKGRSTQYSDIRNYVILRKDYEESKKADALDPRTIFYYGNSARGLRNFKEAHLLYDEFDPVSGNPDDRFAAHYYKASMYLDPECQRPLDALESYKRCTEIHPNDPRGYFGVSRVYAALFRWQECLHWYKIGCGLRIPDNQVFSYDPTHIDWHPHMIAAVACKELGKMEDCVQLAQIALQNRPDYQSAEEIKKSLGFSHMGARLADSVVCVLKSLRNGGPNAQRVAREVCSEIAVVPEELEKLGINRSEEPDPREPRPNLAIYCGASLEDWGPHSRFSGCGGSEKMVILLSEALQKEGTWNVSVYAPVPPEQRGIDPQTGVLWRHWSEFSDTIPRDVFVAWRGHSHLLQKCRARARILWCHDVQSLGSYTPEVLAMVDKIQVQSQYHALPFSNDPRFQDKIWVARNAIEFYMTQDVDSRNPKQVVYCSTPDRGLITTLRIVDQARKVDPEISLVAAYGFTPFTRKCYAANRHRFLPDVGHEISTDLYEQRVSQLLDSTGSTMLHRIGFEELYKLLLSSGVWLYPTRFPEISCMSAMEAQAAGCIPLSTRYAALGETILPFAASLAPPLEPLPETGEVQSGWIDQAASKLLKAVQQPAASKQRQQLAELAWQSFNVDDLAKEWVTTLSEPSLVLHK